jgi:NAD(P)-dependent dehydrogenase (short-subunit alcohol dehydrogenase family)
MTSPDRTVLVTGGTGGLGAAVTARLLAQRWRVVAPWIVQSELSRLPDHPDLELVEADLLNTQDVDAVVGRAAAHKHQPLRAVVNLVGGFHSGGRTHESPISEFESAFRINLTPTHLVTRAALPELIAAGGGSIVGVSSKAAKSPFPGAAGYVSSKAAVWSFIEAIAVEYAADGIRANALFPTVIDTPANRANQPTADRATWVCPEDIASVVAFLIDDASIAVTGAQIPVPGVARRASRP